MGDFDELVLPGYHHTSPNAYQGSDDDVVLADDFDLPIRQQHYQTPVQANFHDLLGLEDSMITAKPTQPAGNLDDIPVKGAAKSFDQLVEEQMRMTDGVATKRKPVQKREFLKRKSGRKGKVGGGKETVEETNIVEDREFDQEQEVPEMKPKQSFLKRGEGKISVKSATSEPVSTATKPSSIPPKPSTQPRPTQTRAGTAPPVKSVPQSLSSKLNSSDSKETKPSYSGAGKPPFGQEDEIEICREELAVVEAVSVKPRLKETKEKQLPETPIFRPNPKIEENIEKLNFQIEQIRTQNLSDRDEMTLKEKQLSDLTSKFDDFLRSKSSKIQSIARWKEEEIKKVKQERRLLDSKLPPVPKRESEDFEDLKSSLNRLQDDLSLRETKRKATLDALKQALAAINTENRVLETELKELEKRRVREGWTGRKQTGNKGKNGQVWG